MIELYEKIINKKVVFVCGDFNIDLLNPQGHMGTTDFINTMYSIGLFPRITKPSRITRSSATLIDNIYSNIIDATVGGLFIHDISDHLPIFTNFHYNLRRNPVKKTLTTFRLRNPETVESLKMDLMRQTWEPVYVADVNEAYYSFLRIFKECYDKNCTPRTYSDGKKENKPWISKTLQNAIKKKNTPYKEFI